jgi:hypothetical protein
MMKRSFLVFTILAMVMVAGARQPQSTDPQKSKHEAMESMNQRGDKVMGFDHTLTTHHFLLRPNGGVIQIEANDRADKASRDQIRSHMRHIAKMFGEGDFSAPMLIHVQNPPGAEVMKKLKGRIQYEFSENAGGAFIRMSTGDPAALKAIHEFLRYQIKEHMTGDPLEAGSTKQ